MDVSGTDETRSGSDLRDDPESPDAAPFDLTPRTGPAPQNAGGGPSKRRWVAIGGLAVLVVALGFVLVRGLGDAATFFYNVDEAVERKAELQGERFRIQGNVKYGSVQETDRGVDFVLRFNGVEVPVEHSGTPPELFGAEIPVVLEGAFVRDTFASDEILIKHDNTYEEQHSDRVSEAEDDAGTAGEDPGTSGPDDDGGSEGGSSSDGDSTGTTEAGRTGEGNGG